MLKSKKCSVCKSQFIKSKPLQKVCSPECALKHVTSLRQRAERKSIKLRLDQLKTRSDHLKDAQKAFNQYIRIRDALLPCISCNTLKENVKYNAGHYLSVGAHPELRFHEWNVHKQCEHCNSFLSGNISAYRPRLIMRIGIDKVEWLEGPHPPVKYTIDDVKNIKKTYQEKLKVLSLQSMRSHFSEA